MALEAAFLDAIRGRITLSGLIGRSLKLDKAGREFKACCPFHGEKSPSFTVNDAKGFYHCFGCGVHGDVFRWLTDHQGMGFMDAVKELAGEAGLEMPAPSPEAAERSAKIETVRGALDVAQGVYAEQLVQAGAVMEYLAGRGIGPDDIARFGIGYARGLDGSLKGRGIGAKLGLAAGLLASREDGSVREMFHDRITIPIHDARGRLVGFGGRVWPGPSTGSGRAGRERPKFVNSPDSAIFDKGRTLFNLHRAAAAARPSAENRLIVAEGYFDVVALTRAGFCACVAPMGTALTEAQMLLLWRQHHCPILLFDGDGAGRKAALRACKLALPALGPGQELAVALLPSGMDPDDLLTNDAMGIGKGKLVAALNEAVPAYRYLFDALAERLGESPTPEAIAAVWAELAEMASSILDAETRAQYLGLWRARYEGELSSVPQVAAIEQVHAVTPAEDGDYAFPESADDSHRRLIAIVRAALKKRAERREITEELADLMKMAEAIGFVKKEINAVIRDIESDLDHGPGRREEAEMARVLYRRTLGIHGPMNEAMLPQIIDGRPRGASSQVQRKATMHALIDARAVEI